MRRLVIFLQKGLFAALVFSYTGANSQSVAYDDFSTESLKSNQKYVWNFNPIDYDSAILNACIIDVINLARDKYNYADALIRNEVLEKAAKVQSAFMAKKRRTDTKQCK
jgi:uncharacterized protein YkwD